MVEREFGQPIVNEAIAGLKQVLGGEGRGIPRSGREAVLADMHRFLDGERGG